MRGTVFNSISRTEPSLLQWNINYLRVVTGERSTLKYASWTGLYLGIL